MNPLTYHRPASVASACDLARSLGPEAAFLAGGTELLVALKQRRTTVRHLISLKAVAELREIRGDADGLTIGAMTTINEVAQSAVVREHFSTLADAAEAMAGAQVRNHATIGGNFCGAVPCADTPPACIVADGTVRIIAADGTQRSVSAAEFFVGPRQTVLRPGELLLAIHLPPQPANSGASYQRFARRRANALAVASVAVRVVLDGPTVAQARFAFGAVAPVPWLATESAARLVGRVPDDAVLAEVGAAAAREARPISDVRSTTDFRRDLVHVLTIRAVRDAIARATSEVFSNAK